MKDYYTANEFAALLNVDPQTVYRWIYSGSVEFVQVKRKGAIRIPASELTRLREQRNN